MTPSSFFTRIFNRIATDRKIGMGLIIALTLLVFFNILQNDFIIPDYEFADQWSVIRDFSNFAQFFAPSAESVSTWQTYSPLKLIFHAIMFQLWEPNASAYHVLALLAHLFITVLVYKIGLKLTKKLPVAFLSALLFGLHPAHTEAVTSITAGVNLIGLLFFFSGFWFYMQAAGERGEIKKGFYTLSLLCAAFAVLTDEIALSLAFLFLLYDCCFREESIGRRSLWLRLAPFFALDLIYFLIKKIVLGHITVHGYFHDSFYLTMLLMIKAMAKYIFLVLWPVVLTTNHMISKGIYSYQLDIVDDQAILYQSFLDAQVLGSLVLVAVLIWLAVRLKKKRPVVSFCIGWFFLSLLPVSNLIPTPVILSERFLYPASFGFCLLAAHFLMQFYNEQDAFLRPHLKWLIIAFAVSIVIFYAQRTISRNQDWQDNIAFYQTEAGINPESASAQASLGVAYMQYGDFSSAISSFKKAVDLRPDEPSYNFSLAGAYSELGQHQQAIHYLEKAVRLNPEFPEAYYNIAVSYAALDQYSLADTFLRKAITFYKEQGREKEAEEAVKAFYEYFGLRSHQIRRNPLKSPE